MSKFLIKSIFFLLLTVPLLELFCFVLYKTDLYKLNLAGNEIYYSISKSKKKHKSKKLLLGDSVGNQLFSNKEKNDSLNSLACNQAISMVGQYILLNNYINEGNEIDTAYLVLTPFSFRNNLDQKFTYHYFLKPFYNSEYLPLFSKTVIHQIEIIPYYQFVSFPHILISTWAPDFKSPDNKNSKLLSPLSIEYLRKIKKLSEKNNFKLILLPTPISINKKKELYRLIDKNQFKQCNLEKEFELYFEKIIYLDSTEFRDGTHLKEPDVYTKLYEKEFLR